MTYAEAQEQLQKAEAALSVALDASSYSVGGRSTTRQEISTLRDQVTYWRREVKRLDDDTDPQNIIPGQSTTITPSWNW